MRGSYVNPAYPDVILGKEEAFGKPDADAMTLARQREGSSIRGFGMTFPVGPNRFTLAGMPRRSARHEEQTGSTGRCQAGGDGPAR
jgi:hypothetical protein